MAFISHSYPDKAQELLWNRGKKGYKSERENYYETVSSTHGRSLHNSTHSSSDSMHKTYTRSSQPKPQQGWRA